MLGYTSASFPAGAVDPGDPHSMQRRVGHGHTRVLLPGALPPRQGHHQFYKIPDSEKYVTVESVCRQGRAAGLPRGAVDPGQPGHEGCLLPAAPRAQRAGRQDPARSGSLHERQGRRHGLPAQRRDLRPVRTADLPGHRHRHRRRQKGPAGLDRRQGRGVALQGGLQDLHRGEPALHPDRGPGHVRREEHRHQPAGPDRHLRHRRHGLQVPVHGQGGRQRQQDACSTRRPRRCSPRRSCSSTWSTR